MRAIGIICFILAGFILIGGVAMGATLLDSPFAGILIGLVAGMGEIIFGCFCICMADIRNNTKRTNENLILIGQAIENILRNQNGQPRETTARQYVSDDNAEPKASEPQPKVVELDPEIYEKVQALLKQRRGE